MPGTKVRSFSRSNRPRATNRPMWRRTVSRGRRFQLAARRSAAAAARYLCRGRCRSDQYELGAWSWALPRSRRGAIERARLHLQMYDIWGRRGSACPAAVAAVAYRSARGAKSGRQDFRQATVSDFVSRWLRARRAGGHSYVWAARGSAQRTKLERENFCQATVSDFVARSCAFRSAFSVFSAEEKRASYQPNIDVY